MIKSPSKLNGAFQKPTSPEDVTTVVGSIDPSALVAIVNTGATYAEIEEAAMWARGELEVPGEEEHPLKGTAADVYDILVDDPQFSADHER